MKPNRISRNLAPLPGKENFRAPGAGHPQQAYSSRPNGAGASSISIEPSGAVYATPELMTVEELIIQANSHLGIGENFRTDKFRSAADCLARACDQGATQRQIAEGVGKSAAWVNRLLQWRKDGHIGAPFADKVVQGVNENGLSSDQVTVEPTSVSEISDTPDEHRLADSSVQAKASVAERNDIAATAERQPTSKKFSGDERARLIETLESLATEQLRQRAQFALNVEKRRAELGLTWDELLKPAEEEPPSFVLDAEHVDQGTDGEECIDEMPDIPEFLRRVVQVNEG